MCDRCVAQAKFNVACHYDYYLSCVNKGPCRMSDLRKSRVTVLIPVVQTRIRLIDQKHLALLYLKPDMRNFMFTCTLRYMGQNGPARSGHYIRSALYKCGFEGQPYVKSKNHIILYFMEFSSVMN